MAELVEAPCRKEVGDPSTGSGIVGRRFPRFAREREPKATVSTPARPGPRAGDRRRPDDGRPDYGRPDDPTKHGVATVPDHREPAVARRPATHHVHGGPATVVRRQPSEARAAAFAGRVATNSSQPSRADPLHPTRTSWSDFRVVADYRPVKWVGGGGSAAGADSPGNEEDDTPNTVGDPPVSGGVGRRRDHYRRRFGLAAAVSGSGRQFGVVRWACGSSPPPSR
jgi:hypothetical protein